MKYLSTLLLIVSLIQTGFSQQTKFYTAYISEADSLYEAKDYVAAGQVHEAAINHYPSRQNAIDLYNAACSWALAGNKDKALNMLLRAVKNYGYAEAKTLENDTDLKSLHSTKKWNTIIANAKKNAAKNSKRFRPNLKMLLDTAAKYDQFYRSKIDATIKKFGANAEEFKALIKQMTSADLKNQQIVMKILDEYGWLSAKEIGAKGNNTLYLVIQHADLPTQKKYLPMLEKAVKTGAAPGSNFAFLTDRILLREDKLQRYGTHVGTYPATQENFVMPMEDPENVDYRRDALGMPPLGVDLKKMYDLGWNASAYKENLPKYERYVMEIRDQQKKVKQP